MAQAHLDEWEIVSHGSDVSESWEMADLPKSPSSASHADSFSAASPSTADDESTPTAEAPERRVVHRQPHRRAVVENLFGNHHRYEVNATHYPPKTLQLKPRNGKQFQKMPRPLPSRATLKKYSHRSAFTSDKNL